MSDGCRGYNRHPGILTENELEKVNGEDIVVETISTDEIEVDTHSDSVSMTYGGGTWTRKTEVYDVTVIYDDVEHDMTVQATSKLHPSNGSDRYEIPLPQSQWPSTLDGVSYVDLRRKGTIVVSDDHGNVISGSIISTNTTNSTVAVVDDHL